MSRVGASKFVPTHAEIQAVAAATAVSPAWLDAREGTPRKVAVITLFELPDGNFSAVAELDGVLIPTGPWYTRGGCLDGIAQRINSHLTSGAGTTAPQPSDGDSA